MENGFYHLDDRIGAALLKADFAVVQCLLQDDASWGAETLRLAGMPAWLWQGFSWAGRLFPARMLPGSRQMFWAQFGAGGPALAYRVERAGGGCVRIVPCAPVGARTRWLLLLGMGLLLPVLLHISGKQARERSARMLPGFCEYLRSRLAK